MSLSFMDHISSALSFVHDLLSSNNFGKASYETNSILTNYQYILKAKELQNAHLLHCLMKESADRPFSQLPLKMNVMVTQANQKRGKNIWSNKRPDKYSIFSVVNFLSECM